MDYQERDRLVSRISSGYLRFRANDGWLLLRTPSRAERYEADFVYDQALEEACLEGLWHDDDLFAFLTDLGVWDESKEELLTKLPKEIEEFKVHLYENFFKSEDRNTVRRALGIARAKLSELHSERHSFDHLSCKGVASVARGRHLVSLCISLPDGRPVLKVSPDLVGLAITAQAASHIPDEEIRELARNDPWRALWACRTAEGKLFGVSPPEYSDEQSRLASCSLLYDSVYGHPEAPPDEFIEDDDVLDGWLIVQRRKRGERDKQSTLDGVLGNNQKIRNSQEVYIPAQTFEDAQKINDLNDPFAKSLKKQRLGIIEARGIVNEMQMPDTVQRLRMELTQKLAAEGRG